VKSEKRKAESPIFRSNAAARGPPARFIFHFSPCTFHFREHFVPFFASAMTRMTWIASWSVTGNRPPLRTAL